MVITPDHEELFRIICDNAARAAPVLLYINIASSQKTLYGLVIRIHKLRVVLIFCYIKFDIWVLSSDISIIQFDLQVLQMTLQK